MVRGVWDFPNGDLEMCRCQAARLDPKGFPNVLKIKDLILRTLLDPCYLTLDPGPWTL